MLKVKVDAFDLEKTKYFSSDIRENGKIGDNTNLSMGKKQY